MTWHALTKLKFRDLWPIFLNLTKCTKFLYAKKQKCCFHYGTLAVQSLNSRILDSIFIISDPVHERPSSLLQAPSEPEELDFVPSNVLPVTLGVSRKRRRGRGRYGGRPSSNSVRDARIVEQYYRDHPDQRPEGLEHVTPGCVQLWLKVGAQ